MRKATLGRKYYHKQLAILRGHSIMIAVRSPNKCREHGTVDYDLITRVDDTQQQTNRLAYIPFERTRIVSGKKSREAFESDLTAHHDKVEAAIAKYKDSRVTSLADIKYTSKIIRP